MVIHIQTGKNNVIFGPSESKVQSIPFKIHADCDAKVTKYFESNLKKNAENEMLTTSFRGHTLHGRTLELPSGYIGTLLHESLKPSDEKEDRKFYLVNKFRRFTMWNWDKAPSKNDKMAQVLDWVEIAEVLHKPIEEDEMN